MGGDLNLKKSWHPVLMSNQRKVWEEEKKAIEERKKIDQIMRERQEERQIQELQELQEAAGGKKRQSRVDWMYSGPATGQTGTTEEMEGYLLGKRRIDGLIKGSETEKLEKNAQEDSFMAMQNANTARDTAAKVREDPMLAIKKQEQAAYEAMMNDPVKRRALLRAAGGDTRSSDQDHKHRKRRHHDDGERRSRHRSRREDDDDKYHKSRTHRRRRSYSLEDSRSPPRRSRRSPSPYRNRRSRSPSDRDRDRRRSRSPYRRRDHRDERDKRRTWHAPDRHSEDRDKYSSSRLKKDDNTERAAKLAAMQQAANELDEDREQRLAALAAKDQAQAEVDNAARARNAKYGGRADFMNGVNRKAANLDLGERVRRNKSGLEREQEAY
ncbi:putative pre-mrna-splicing factor cwc25 [Phaeomoniella chlamydospora]|uniref:Putative pre-mrna-splicing factor cwc25 n=1 Tax=Phaeomoniella chlamydospora TaxID=158046 RepID=A0A0G2H820_PHACM|nr:putative pre-mrna-splicing factor cwc25 [Phaeomoniella chlamydospora]